MLLQQVLTKRELPCILLTVVNLRQDMMTMAMPSGCNLTVESHHNEDQSIMLAGQSMLAGAYASAGMAAGSPFHMSSGVSWAAHCGLWCGAASSIWPCRSLVRPRAFGLPRSRLLVSL